jgi:hypothetical protein
LKTDTGRGVRFGGFADFDLACIRRDVGFHDRGIGANKLPQNMPRRQLKLPRRRPKINGWHMAIAVVSNEGRLIYLGRVGVPSSDSHDASTQSATSAAAAFRHAQEAVAGRPSGCCGDEVVDRRIGGFQQK